MVVGVVGALVEPSRCFVCLIYAFSYGVANSIMSTILSGLVSSARVAISGSILLR